ncbi:protein gp37 [Bradyrhizobium brasilense]|uniref:Protein gp37 n=1 Tax=Bradyrhizobium brasilense TaxID=1419277 RepID=A0A1G6IP39_9BRAD|nr:phage Gp37/Gp68 family protein [Bradyrhizobium brasilense]SDC08210.1 protein gp37 [Bradyrhizobium brasilense]
MAGKSPIEWTEQTWNPIVGCSIVSPGCTNCYAMAMASRIEAMNAEARESDQAQGKRRRAASQYDGTTRKVNGNPVWTGKVAPAPESVLLAPLQRKKPTTYFVNSMGDLFHEDVPDEWIDRVFAVMALAPQHTFQVLTKRAKRMREYLSNARARIVRRSGEGNPNVTVSTEKTYRSSTKIGGDWAWPLPNVWLGVSTERQQEADERIPELLATPAAIRFISAEPLLGPIDLTNHCNGHYFFDSLRGARWHDNPDGPNPQQKYAPGLDWVIVGGESGPAARPMHPDWARSLRDQCAAANVPFFFKQWGAYRPLTEIEKVTACGATIFYPEPTSRNGPQGGVYMLQVPKKLAGRELDGVEHNGFPTREGA